MLRLRVFGQCAVVFLLMSCLGGCFQGENRSDEEQDAHFQRGRNLASSQDFKGAALEFEKALENNPNSAAAHFELGWLYDTKLNDYAAAIYHYERHLSLQPDSGRASLVKERIKGCKQGLANSEFPLPNSGNLQREADRLNAENVQLKQQVESLKKQLEAASAAALAAQSRADTVRYYASAPAAAAAVADQETPRPIPTSTGSHSRVHIVRPHETITSIAAQHGVKASAILAANPQTNPRRLRVGQSLILP
jgi:LysM repeat protein